MTQRRVWLAIAMAMALLVSACGSDGDDAEPAADTEESASVDDSGSADDAPDEADGDDDTSDDAQDEDAPADDDSTTDEAAPDDDAAEPAGDTKLVIAQGVDPRTFTPWTSLAAELSVTTQIFERLISFNLDTGDYDPVLAESYEWVDDVTLTIPLREGVTFSNGEPFNADAAILSFEVLRDAETGGIEMSSRTANLASVEKIDDMTIQVNFLEPIARALNLANLSQSTFMVPPEYFAEVGFDGFIQDPIGTGPMVLTERVRDSSILLSRNETYAGSSGPAPAVDQIEFRILPEAGARLAALEAGDVDIVVDLPFEEADRLGGMDGIDVVSIPGLRIMELQVDIRNGMSEASAVQEVRQALLYALDRQLIIDAVFLGQGAPVNQLAVEQYFGFVEDLPPLEYDPDRVAELLAAGGYPDGVSIPLKCPSGRYLKDRELCEIIVSELAKVGIDATPFEAFEVGAFFDGVLAGEMGPMIYIGRLAPSLNMVDMYNSSLCRSSDSYKCDEELDALHEAARAAIDPDDQRAAIAEMVRFDLDDPNRIPLWVLNDVYAVSGDVQGWAPRADQVLEFWGVQVGS